MNTLIALSRYALVVSSLMIAYTLLIYPLATSVAAAFKGNGSNGGYEELPTVSIIVAAYNEEEVIAEKIKNCLQLEYPSDRLEIFVFSDGSTDGTDDIVRSYADDGIELVRIEGRVGKTACQNIVADRATGEILVFSDANSMYEPDAIRALVNEFEEDVGCVVGGLHYEHTGQNTKGIPTYRQFERFVQYAQSRIGSVVKGNGAIYAVRAKDYVPLGSDLISDFGEPLAIRASGKRVGFSPKAIAREQARDDLDAQLAAENRITTRVWHTLREFTELLNPREYGFYAVQVWSRTVLLWLTPVFLGVATISILLLVILRPTTVNLLLLGGLLTFSLSLISTELFRRTGRSAPLPLQTVYYFGLLNYSLLVGLVNFVRGRNIVTWDTDERVSSGEGSDATSNELK